MPSSRKPAWSPSSAAPVSASGPKERVTIDGRGKCEGRKNLAERSPEVVEAAHALNDGRSLRKIAAALAEQGFVTPSGTRLFRNAVKRMLGEGGSKSRALKHTDAKGRRLLWPE